MKYVFKKAKYTIDYPAMQRDNTMLFNILLYNEKTGRYDRKLRVDNKVYSTDKIYLVKELVLKINYGEYKI